MSYKAVLSWAKLVSHSYYHVVNTLFLYVVIPDSFRQAGANDENNCRKIKSRARARICILAYAFVCLWVYCTWICITWELHPRLVTCWAEQDVHIRMKLKGREQRQWETWFFTGSLLLEPACKMQIWQRKKKSYFPLRHEIHISMHFVFFYENVYMVNMLLTCYLSLSVWFSIITYFTIHMSDIESNDFVSEIHTDFVHTDMREFAFLSLSLPHTHIYACFGLTCRNTDRHPWDRDRPTNFMHCSDQTHLVQHWGFCKLGWEIIIGSLNVAAILINFT